MRFMKSVVLRFSDGLLVVELLPLVFVVPEVEPTGVVVMLLDSEGV